MASNENKEYKGVGIAPSEENNDWIKDYCEDKESIREIELNSFTGHGGLSAEMKKLQIHYQNGTTKKYIYKTTAKDRQQRSQQLGLSREAYFYHHLADKLREHKVNLPKVIYVHGDVTTGEKTIILEDLSETSVQSGYFFGSSSPHNWGKDLPQLIAQNNISGYTNSMEEVAIESFKTAARLHGTYWMDHSLLDFHWLRGTQWVKGEGEISWVGAQQTASNIWANTLKKIENGESKVKWNDLLISCVNSSFAKVNWEKYQEELKHRKWTLVHGDFHPANIMWRWLANKNNDNNGEKNDYYDNSRYQDYLDMDNNKKGGEPIFLDFEMVGIGNGAQDLAQYLISHMSPSDRLSLEDNLIQKYYNELLLSNNQLNNENYSFEECKKDYVEGGALRWVWLLAALSGMCPDPLLQFFQDQLAAFFIDHSFTPENIGMPRV